MVDLMCSFGFGVLCFVLHLFSPRICIWQVWVIGWDYSMFLCPSAPPWLCHQSLLHPVVGALSCWEYVSRRFETTCSWRARPWNLFHFEHLWHSQSDSYSFQFELGSLSCFFSIFMVFRSCFCKFLSSHSGRYLAQGCRHCHGTQIRCIRLPHPCTVRKLQQRNGTSAFRLGCLGPSSPVSEPQQHEVLRPLRALPWFLRLLHLLSCGRGPEQEHYWYTLISQLPWVGEIEHAWWFTALLRQHGDWQNSFCFAYRPTYKAVLSSPPGLVGRLWR